MGPISEFHVRDACTVTSVKNETSRRLGTLRITTATLLAGTISSFKREVKMAPSSNPKLHVTSIAPAKSKIKAFGKVKKPQLNRQGDGRTKLNQKSHTAVAKATSVASGVSTNSKKRKLETQDAIDCDPTLPGEQDTPRKKRAVNLKTAAATPTTDVKYSCLPEKISASSPESSDPASNPTSSSCSLECASSSLSTPPSSPASEKVSSTPDRETATKLLPDELQDLINLYSSFLTALSLHYAHHGSLTPADVRILRPGIERAWGKRRITNDDVRRILAIAQQNLPASAEDGGKILGGGCYKGTFFLSDYGLGKICIEIEEDVQNQGQGGVRRCPINEEVLNAEFVESLEAQWSQYVSKCDNRPSAPSFIAVLPLFPIKTCASISKIGPLLSKGQRRLEELKAGAIKAQQVSSPSTSSEAKLTTKIAPTKRRDSLLSRIRAKQQLHHQSKLASPRPSKTTILRKSALQRLEEFAPVLEILTSSASRSSTFSSSHSLNNNNTTNIRICSSSSHHLMDTTEQHGTYSFTMPTLIQHLQMSLKNPISKEDAVSCVKLLATEVAPNWVKIKEVGKVVGVTVWRGGRINKEELVGRIEELLGKLG